MQGREMYNRSVQRESRELKLARVRVVVGRVGPAREVQGKPHGGGGTQAESSKDVQVCPRKIGKTSIPEKGTE